MNHTERAYHVARQVRGLTREMARQAVERYLASAAQELARGEWVTLPGIGRIQIIARKNGGMLLAKLGKGPDRYRSPGVRLQARVRLNDDFKRQCHTYLSTSPVSTRVQADERQDYPGSDRAKPGKENG